MASKTLAVVYILAMSALSRADIPQGYILQVTPTCGADATVDAMIHIITDLQAIAIAVCANGVTASFITTDKVNFYLPVSYPNQGRHPCVFQKRHNALVFVVNVMVAYGEPDDLVHQNEEEYTVTCTFSRTGGDDSLHHNVVEGLIAPTEILSSMGMNSSSTFTLEMVNVLGDPLVGQNVSLGRIVRLQGVTSAADGEVGLRPVSCFAIDGDSRYAILRAGCGDGIVFRKDRGFTTTGTKTLSPYFAAFSINHGSVVTFQCIFVTCSKNCDGSSCEVERDV